MTEKTISLVVVLTLLGVGTVATIGLTGANTGYALLPARGCDCVIEKYDYYGNVIGTQIQPIRVKSAQALTEAGCNNRCEIMFGRARAHYAAKRTFGTVDYDVQVE